MKRIISIVIAIASIAIMTSCEKAEQPKPTTYTITMDMPSVTSTASIHYDLTAFEYNEDGEKVANNALVMAVTGSSKTFTANPRAVKVKLCIKMYSDTQGYSPQYLWMQQVFYLEEGKNIEIKVEEHSKVGQLEP